MALYSIGIHIGHDRSAALIKDGELVAAIAEERLDRHKHSNSPQLPIRAIAAVLDMTETEPTQVGVVGVSYTNVVIADILSQLRDEILDLYPRWSPEVIGFTHHDCHAWSSYYTCQLDRPLVIVADGAGDIVGDKLEAETVYAGDGDMIRPVGQRLQDFGLLRTDRRNTYNLAYMHAEDRGKQISLGRKYEQLTYLIGFSHGQSGKTMGLAAGHKPLVLPPVETPTCYDFSLTFDDLLVEIHDLWSSSGEPWHIFIDRRKGELAAAAQAWVEHFMISFVKLAMRTENRTNICLSGGLFLNCTMNHKLLAQCGVNAMHIIPAAGDDGQSVGAAFAAYRQIHGSARRSGTHLPYLGKQYPDTLIERTLAYFGLTAKKMDDAWLAEQVAEDLKNGHIVGMFRGRSEFGPRALGHRSILTDPRRPGMTECLNRIKGRELFRPFAPMVTWEEQFDYFELAAPSPHMLFATMVKPEFRSSLAAITHVDGSARVQAVHQDKEPFLHRLLLASKQLTGFPILLNTSFNLAGDPIVESPHDAIATFLASGLDRLVLGPYYVASKVRTSCRPRIEM